MPDDEEKSEAIIRRPTTALMPDVEGLMILGDALAKSKMFPSVKDKYQALAIIEYGREIGIKPIMALQSMCIIKEKVAIESKVLLALAKENGTKVEIIQKDTKACILKFSKGRQNHTEKFIWQDVERAGLAGKTNYLTYPEEMLFWRCVAKGLRVFDPGLALGLYTKEELDEEAPEQVTLQVTPKREEEETVIEAEVVEEKEEEKPKPATKKAKPKAEKKEPAPPPEPEVEETEEVEEEPEEEAKEEAATEDASDPSQMTEQEKREYYKQKILEDFYIRFGPKKQMEKYREFKLFLLEWQKTRKEPRRFVDLNDFNHASMSSGKGDDLKLLVENLALVMTHWKKFEDEQAEATAHILGSSKDDLS